MDYSEYQVVLLTILNQPLHNYSWGQLYSVKATYPLFSAFLHYSQTCLLGTSHINGELLIIMNKFFHYFQPFCYTIFEFVQVLFVILQQLHLILRFSDVKDFDLSVTYTYKTIYNILYCTTLKFDSCCSICSTTSSIYLL